MRLSRLVSLILTAGCPTVGGQAVLEGVMMRNGDAYALALRRPDGEIVALSGATITSRAVTEGVQAAIDYAATQQ